MSSDSEADSHLSDTADDYAAEEPTDNEYSDVSIGSDVSDDSLRERAVSLVRKNGQLKQKVSALREYCRKIVAIGKKALRTVRASVQRKTVKETVRRQTAQLNHLLPVLYYVVAKSGNTFEAYRRAAHHVHDTPGYVN